MIKSPLLKQVYVCVSLFFIKPQVPAGKTLPHIRGHSAETANNQADFQQWLSVEWTSLASLSCFHSLSPFLLQSLSTWKENLLLAQFKWNLPSYQWILTFNILAPLLASVCPTFIMQYVLLSSCGPLALTIKCLCITLSKAEATIQGEMEFYLWLSTVFKSCSCNFKVLPNSVYTNCPIWHHLFSIANTWSYSDFIRPCNLFACLQKNPSNFIKARATGKCMTADLVLRHASQLSHVLSFSQFSRVEKSCCPVYIPF